MRLVTALTLALFVHTVPNWSAKAVAMEESTMANAPLAGKEVRASIDRRYVLLKGSGQLKPNGRGINDISDILSTAIRRGTSLEDASAILRAAGFQVAPIGANVLHPRGVYAEIRNYDQIPFAAVTVTAVLELNPDSPDQTVSSVSGAIVLQLP